MTRESRRFRRLADWCVTLGLLAAAFFASLLLSRMTQGNTLIPTVFVLAVFLAAYFTDGYFCGICASILGMLAVNFAFTFPYFELNFSIPENLMSSGAMLVIACMTSALTTQVKHQERIRAESQRETMRANLLRAVSHDLRTPLTTIYGSSAAIIDNFRRLSDPQKLELLRGIRDDSQWLVDMVENLLSVTKLDTGNVELIKTDTVLEELIDTVLVKFRKRYPRQAVEVSIPEEFVSIPMDAVLITQVLMNLLENAVLHARGMTRLELKVVCGQGIARFLVRDDGCGIPRERLEDLFTGYLGSAQDRSDAKRRNMGIGLSVCATIVKAHSGKITARNRPQGGAEFEFLLKLEDNHGQEPI